MRSAYLCPLPFCGIHQTLYHPLFADSENKRKKEKEKSFLLNKQTLANRHIAPEQYLYLWYKCNKFKTNAYTEEQTTWVRKTKKHEWRESANKINSQTVQKSTLGKPLSWVHSEHATYYCAVLLWTYSHLEETQNNRAGSTENRQCANISFCRLCSVVLSKITQQRYFFFVLWM